MPTLISVCCAGCAPYYRNVLTYVPGGASIIALLALVVVVTMVQIKKRRGMLIIILIRLITCMISHFICKFSFHHTVIMAPVDVEKDGRYSTMPHKYTIQKRDSNTISESLDERAPLINKRK